MKVAQGLLLRKQLEDKVKQLQPIREMGEKGLFEVHHKRTNVNEQLDEVTFQIPKVTLAEVTKEYDKFASALRKLDAAIQKANWENELDFKDNDNPLG